MELATGADGAASGARAYEDADGTDGGGTGAYERADGAGGGAPGATEKLFGGGGAAPQYPVGTAPNPGANEGTDGDQRGADASYSLL